MFHSTVCSYFVSLLACLSSQVFSQKQAPLLLGKPVPQPAPLPTTNCPGACMLGKILCPSSRIQCVLPSSCYQLISNGKEMMYVVKNSINSALPVVATGKHTAGLLSDCKDHNPNCRPFMELCKDKLYNMFLTTYCPKTCGFCASSFTTTTTPQPNLNLGVQPPKFSLFASSPAPLPLRRTAKHVPENKKRPLRKWLALTTTPLTTTHSATSTKKKSNKRKNIATSTTALLSSLTTTTSEQPTTPSHQDNSQEEGEEEATENPAETTTSIHYSKEEVVTEDKEPEGVERTHLSATENKSNIRLEEKGEQERSERQKKEVSSSTEPPTTTPVNVLVQISSSINAISLVSREVARPAVPNLKGEATSSPTPLLAPSPDRLIRPESIVGVKKPKRCGDQSPNCNTFAKYCRDDAFVEIMSSFCKKTCKLC